MALLGFDAVGHWALGHPPAQSIMLTASVGTFTESGVAETFTFNVPESVQSFALTGIAQSFTTLEATITGALEFGGIAAIYSFSDIVSAGGYSLSGIAEILNPLLLASRANFSVGTFDIPKGVTSTMLILQQPINCVLMGQQLYDRTARTLERIPGKSGRRSIVGLAAGGRIGALSSFTTKTSSRGYD